MDLSEILKNMDTTSDYETLIEKLRIQLGCRKPHKLFSLISDIIGVKESSMMRWLNGNRAVTKQALRSLQMLDLLLRISKDYNPLPLKTVPALENKAHNTQQQSDSKTYQTKPLESVEEILEKLDLD